MARIRYVAVVPMLTAVLALAGCGGGSGGSNSSSRPNSSPAVTSSSATTRNAPADKAAATAQIKAAYRKFFSANAHTAGKYLEDGQTLGRSFGALQKLASGATIKANVKTVTFTSPSSAQVTYALAVGGHPVFGSAPGQAVLVGGHWVVAKATFCGLAQLGVGQGHKVPGC